MCEWVGASDHHTHTLGSGLLVLSSLNPSPLLPIAFVCTGSTGMQPVLARLTVAWGSSALVALSVNCEQLRVHRFQVPRCIRSISMLAKLLTVKCTSTHHSTVTSQ